MAIVINRRAKATETLGTTTGGIDILSYNSVVELDDIFQQTIYFDTWNDWKRNKTAEEINRVLIQATNYIDGYDDYTGMKVDAMQPNEWGREGVTCNGVAVPDTAPFVPNDIRIAHAFLVLSYILNPVNQTINTGGGTSTTHPITEVDADGVLVKFDTSGAVVDVAERSIRTGEFDPHVYADQLLACYRTSTQAGRGLDGRYFGGTQRSYFSDPNPFRRN